MSKSGPSLLVIAFSLCSASSAQLAYLANAKHHTHLAGIGIYCAVLFALYAVHAAIERTRDR